LNYVTLYGTKLSKLGIFKVIHSFRDQWLEAFFVDDKISKKIPAGLDKRLFRKLQLIDDASSDIDLRSPPSNHFEKLKGNLAGYCSIRINDQWRLIFQWDGNKSEASDLYLDNHSYR
jgi:toxin HigB-1